MADPNFSPDVAQIQPPLEVPDRNRKPRTCRRRGDSTGRMNLSGRSEQRRDEVSSLVTIAIAKITSRPVRVSIHQYSVIPSVLTATFFALWSIQLFHEVGQILRVPEG
jgi:hypothetical protein